ncbi:hypothetical protein LCGC14_2346400, partial [marine sediment metagenome]
ADFYVDAGGEQSRGLTSNIKNGEPTEFWIGYRNQGPSNEPVFIRISRVYPIDSKIVYATNRTYYFPGTLIVNDLYQNKFISSGVYYERFDLSFSTASSTTVFVNYSSRGLLGSRKGYLNFTITAYDLDSGNDFYFKENFTTNNSINFTSLLNVSGYMSVFDDFQNNETSSRYTTTGACTLPIITTPNSDNYLSVTAQGNSNCEITFDTLKIDNISIFNFTATKGRSHVCGSSCQATATHAIIATDGDNKVDLYSEAISLGIPSRSSTNFYRYSGFRSGTTWTIYRNGTQIGTGDVSALNSPIYLVIKSSFSGSFGTTGEDFWRIYEFNTSGIRLKRQNGTYEDRVSDGSFESATLFTSSSNIARVFVSLSKEEPTSTSIKYFTSNNNGTSYEGFTPNNFHTFTTTGKALKVKFVLNTTDNLSSPFIPTYTAQIIPASVSGLFVDIGNDGVFELNFSGTLNSTTTPINYSGNDSAINDYINTFCLADTHCVIPFVISTGSGGIIELSNLNLTENINPVYLNVTPIQDLNEIILSPTYTGGTVQFDDLRFDFRGSKNIT